MPEIGYKSGSRIQSRETVALEMVKQCQGIGREGRIQDPVKGNLTHHSLS